MPTNAHPYWTPGYVRRLVLAIHHVRQTGTGAASVGIKDPGIKDPPHHQACTCPEPERPT